MNLELRLNWSGRNITVTIHLLYIPPPPPPGHLCLFAGVRHTPLRSGFSTYSIIYCPGLLYKEVVNCLFLYIGIYCSIML